MAQRPSTENHDGMYKGVIRDGGKIVWRCDHWHTNRDHGTWSAHQCAFQALHAQAKGI